MCRDIKYKIKTDEMDVSCVQPSVCYEISIYCEDDIVYVLTCNIERNSVDEIKDIEIKVLKDDIAIFDYCVDADEYEEYRYRIGLTEALQRDYDDLCDDYNIEIPTTQCLCDTVMFKMKMMKRCIEISEIVDKYISGLYYLHMTKIFFDKIHDSE
mgnify:FL=1